MEDREYKNAYESLKRLHDSANSAIIGLQKQLNDLQEQLKLVMAINSSLEQQVIINKNIVRETLTTNNQANNEQLEEINRLRGIITELKGD